MKIKIITYFLLFLLFLLLLIFYFRSRNTTRNNYKNILNLQDNENKKYFKKEYIEKEYNENKYNENKYNEKKILNLILYSENYYYDQMKKILTKYLKNTNISFYFYCYKSKLKEDYYIDENEHIVYIKGEESLIPGCLEKTIKIFEIFRNNDYDYIVRTNISTIINFKILQYELNDNKIDYGGPYIITWGNKENTDYFYIPKEHRNINYVSGICIILSKKIIELIIKNKYLICNYNIIDDFAFGSFLQKNNTEIKTINYTINANDIISNCICYRNNDENNDRNNDLKNMKTITESIISKFYI